MVWTEYYGINEVAIEELVNLLSFSYCYFVGMALY